MAVPLALGAGYRHACAVMSDGTTRCWGSNETLQLGLSSADTCQVELGPSGPEPFACKKAPTPVPGLSDVKQVACGDGHTCALTNAGTVSCWGNDSSGQLGDGQAGGSRAQPQAVPGLVGVVAIGAGAIHSCALLGDGTVQCWGGATNGQLGLGGKNQSATPAQVNGVSGVTALAVGAYHTCALSPSGVFCWGMNQYGEVGNGASATDEIFPAKVANLADAVAIAAGGWHTCATRAGGEIVCWGHNQEGQLGSGTPGFGNTQTQPTLVALPSSASKLACGREHTCVVIADGTARCWGSNDHGELGAGTTAGPLVTPQVVSGLASVSSFALGAVFSTALVTGGTAQGFGWNAFGALGTGDAKDSATPVAITF